MPYDDILYFESDARKIKVVTCKTVNEFYGSMKELEKNLPMNFLPIHQSYTINKEHVVRYTYEMVEMDNGKTLMISHLCFNESVSGLSDQPIHKSIFEW